MSKFTTVHEYYLQGYTLSLLMTLTKRQKIFYKKVKSQEPNLLHSAIKIILRNISLITFEVIAQLY